MGEIQCCTSLLLNDGHGKKWKNKFNIMMRLAIATSATVHRRATHDIPGLALCDRRLIILPETVRRILHAI